MAVEPGVVVTGDKELLAQLFANLIENALTHTPPGSHVEVALAREGGGPVATVADDGPGVPAAMRERVLKRFVRLEASRSTPGSGLGLAGVAAIARLHGIGLELADNRPGLRVTLGFGGDGRAGPGPGTHQGFRPVLSGTAPRLRTASRPGAAPHVPRGRVRRRPGHRATTRCADGAQVVGGRRFWLRQIRGRAAAW